MVWFLKLLLISLFQILPFICQQDMNGRIYIYCYDDCQVYQGNTKLTLQTAESNISEYRTLYWVPFTNEDESIYIIGDPNKFYSGFSYFIKMGERYYPLIYDTTTRCSPKHHEAGILEMRSCFSFNLHPTYNLINTDIKTYVDHTNIAYIKLKLPLSNSFEAVESLNFYLFNIKEATTINFEQYCTNQIQNNFNIVISNCDIIIIIDNQETTPTNNECTIQLNNPYTISFNFIDGANSSVIFQFKCPNKKKEDKLTISPNEDGCKIFNYLKSSCEECETGYKFYNDEKHCHKVNNKEYYDFNTNSYHPCHAKCSECNQGGTDEYPNCISCIDGYFTYDKKISGYDSICLKSCSEYGLMEILWKRTCVKGCKSNEYVYDDKICFYDKNKLSNVGFFKIYELNKFVMNCPDDHPFLVNTSSTMTDANSMGCMKGCPNEAPFIYRDNYEGQKLCLNKCPEGQFVNSEYFCEEKELNTVYCSYSNTNPNIGPVFVKNCNDFGFIGYFRNDNSCSCEDSQPYDSYEYYDGTVRKYVNDCPSPSRNDDNSRKCVFSMCDENFCLNNSNGQCESLSSKEYYGYINRTCLANCDNGFLVYDNGCIDECPYDFPYTKEKNKCIKQCPDNYFAYGKQCFSICPETIDNNKIYIDEELQECVTSQGYKYILENTVKLVEQCPKNYYVYDMTCVSKCPSDRPFINTNNLANECVSSCPHKQPYLITATKTCVIECPLDSYIQNRQCVSDCGEKNLNGLWEFSDPIINCGDYCGQLNGSTCILYCPEGLIVEACNNFEVNDGSTNIKMEVSKESILENLDKSLDTLTQLNKTIFGNDFSLQVYPSDKPLPEEPGVTTIDLGECGEKLKKENGLDKLLIVKMDINREGTPLKQVEYKVYSPDGVLLDLSICNDTKVKIQYTITDELGVNLASLLSLNEKGIDILNTSSSFYNDICFPHASENGGDVILKDRRQDIFPNVSICDTGCEYAGIESETMKIDCNCDVKTEMSSEVVEPAQVGFADSLLGSTNIMLFKCYKIVIDFSNYGENIGLYIMGSLYLLSIILFLIHCCTFTFKVAHITAIMSKNQETKACPVKKKQKTQRKINIGFETDDEKDINDTSDVIKKKKVKVEEKEEIIKVNDCKPLFQEDEEEKDDNEKPLAKLICDIFASKLDFINILFLYKQFDFVYLELLGYIFEFSLDFMMNSILFTDDVISTNYQNNGKMSMATSFFLSYVSNIITSVISSLVLKLITISPVLEMMNTEHLTEIVRLKWIRKFQKIAKIRVAIFSIIHFICMTVFVYYLTIFCTVYKNSQTSWLKDCLTGCLISLLISMGVSIIFGLLKYSAVKCQIRRMYYISWYLIEKVF